MAHKTMEFNRGLTKREIKILFGVDLAGIALMLFGDEIGNYLVIAIGLLVIYCIAIALSSLVSANCKYIVVMEIKEG